MTNEHRQDPSAGAQTLNHTDPAPASSTTQDSADADPATATQTHDASSSLGAQLHATTISMDDAAAQQEKNPSPARSSKSGWDGKLRLEKKPIITNPEALSDPEYSDEDAPPVDVIDADEGAFCPGEYDQESGERG